MEISKSKAVHRNGKVSVRSAQNAPRKDCGEFVVDSKTHFCPRCKQDRLKEWFGHPKAPYAICLSCRVEVNGEKAKKPALRKVGRNCAICEAVISEQAELCQKCETGLSCFDNKVKLLGRAASFLSGKLRRSNRKQKPKRRKTQNVKLQRLIHEQYSDERDRNLRFEHAISER